MIITGTLREVEGQLRIERDDGASPNVFVHAEVARRCGFEPPYDSRRVRAEVLKDWVGNSCALSISTLEDSATDAAAHGAARPDGDLEAVIRLSPQQVRGLVERGYLNDAPQHDPAAIAAAVARLVGRALGRP